MDGYGPETYGERIALAYDDLHPADGGPLATAAAVECLARLANGGRALELAVGTGRIAVPLAAEGVSVAGIDASPAMVAQLRAKPGGDAIPVAMGDFGRPDELVDGPFALVFVVFNTLFALLTQEDQLRCLCGVERLLAPGGRFLVEAFVPDLTRFRNDQALTTTRVELDRVVLDASRHDPVAQRVDAMHIVITGPTVETHPVALRYAWPTELDLMARLAGLEPEHRWGGWHGEPFTAASTSHVSVYRRPA